MLAHRYIFRRGIAVYGGQKASFSSSEGPGQVASAIASLSQLKDCRNVVHIENIFDSLNSLHSHRICIPLRYFKYTVDVLVQRKQFADLQNLLSLYKHNNSSSSDTISATHKEFIDYILLKCAVSSSVEPLYQIWRSSLLIGYSLCQSTVTDIMRKANLSDDNGASLFNNMHKLCVSNLWNQSCGYYLNFFFAQCKRSGNAEKQKLFDISNAKSFIHPLDKEIALLDSISSRSLDSNASAAVKHLVYSWGAEPAAHLEKQLVTAFEVSPKTAQSMTIDPNNCPSGSLVHAIQRQHLIDLITHFSRRHKTSAAIALLEKYLTHISPAADPSSLRPYNDLLPLSSRYEASACARFSSAGRIPLKRVQLTEEQFRESLFIQVINQMKFQSNASIEKGNKTALLQRIESVNAAAAALVDLAKKHNVTLSANFYAAHISAMPHNMPSAWKLTHKAVTTIITSLPPAILSDPVIFYAHMTHLCDYLLPESVDFALQMLIARLEADKPVSPSTYNILISAATQVLSDDRLISLLQHAGMSHLSEPPRDPQRFVSNDISLYQILSEEQYFKNRFRSVLAPVACDGDAGVMLASVFAYARLNNSLACFLLLSKLQAMNIAIPRAAYVAVLDAAATTPRTDDPPLQRYAFLQPAETSDFLLSAMARDDVGVCRRMLAGLILLYRGSVVYYSAKGWSTDEIISDAKAFISSLLSKYNITLDSRCIAALVGLYVNSGREITIDDIITISDEYKIPVDISHFLPLVKHLLSSEETLHEALNVLDELSSRGIAISSDVIDTVALGLTRTSYNTEIPSVLQEFSTTYNIRPSARSLIEILEIYLVSGEVELAKGLVDVIRSMYTEQERETLVYQMPRRKMRIAGALSEEKLKEKFREFNCELVL